jgi:hypothetical protein
MLSVMEAKRGRPAKPIAERLTETIQVKVSVAERKALEKAAGGSVSAWARTVLLKSVKRTTS